MAYSLRNEKGLPIKRNDVPVTVADTIDVKIEQLDEKNMSFIAVASDESEDRDKDIIRQDGWDLKNFKKNPVIPWSHNYWSVPVARSLKTWVDKATKRLLFKPQFDSTDPDSVKLFNKYKNGFLTSFSVGFRGINFNWRDEENRWMGGREFIKQELLEISSVAIPANPNASTRLSVNGCQLSNMAQMGFPEYFAKTQSGLFYPVKDIVLFSNPQEVSIEDGVIGIKAIALDDDIDADTPVAYIFDEKKFNAKEINEWIEQNVEPIWKQKYFEVSNLEGDKFTIESIVEEKEIQRFDTLVDLVKSDTTDADDIQIEDDIAEDAPDGKDDSVPDAKSDLDVSDDAQTSTDETKADQSDETTNDDNDTEDVSDGKNISVETEQVIAISEKALVDFLNQVKTGICDCVRDVMKEYDIPMKKSIAIQEQISDNTDINTDGDSINGDKSENSEMVELDESFNVSPGTTKEITSDDDFIELDDETLMETRSETVDVAKDVFADLMRTQLKRILDDATGKID
jgi:HK97 family phage prohead protease